MGKLESLSLELPPSSIVTMRGQKVIFDSDLARIYGVSTKVLNQAIKRNRKKFPDDFIFRLTVEEMAMLGNRSQIVTGSQKHRDPRYRPHAFTEHGAIMAATVLNSSRAVQMSVFVVRAFVKMRTALGQSRDLAKKLSALEKELKKRLGVHDAAIVTVLQRVMDLLDPPALPEPPKRQIGFRVEEGEEPYGRSNRSIRLKVRRHRWN